MIDARSDRRASCVSASFGRAYIKALRNGSYYTFYKPLFSLVRNATRECNNLGEAQGTRNKERVGEHLQELTRSSQGALTRECTSAHKSRDLYMAVFNHRERSRLLSMV